MFRRPNLAKRFPKWVEERRGNFEVVIESPLYWILTEKHGILPCSIHNDRIAVFKRNEISRYEISDKDLVEYYHLREEQFRKDNDRIRKQNEELVRKLAEEEFENETLENELETVKTELNLVKREKWKQLFDSVLKEVTIGTKYQNDMNRMRKMYELEKQNRRGFLARILGK